MANSRKRVHPHAVVGDPATFMRLKDIKEIFGAHAAQLIRDERATAKRPRRRMTDSEIKAGMISKPLEGVPEPC